MDASYRLILFLMLCYFSNLVFTQDYKKPEQLDPRISKFHKDARSKKSIKKPDPVKDIDLSYPGCGFRSPKIQETSAQISKTGEGGLIAHSGKRPTSGGFAMIVGGFSAENNSWPWMVGLYKRKKGQIRKTFYCGASLISQNYVLTAAHCCDDEEGKIETDPSKFSVFVGAHIINDGTEYSVRKIIIHPGYKLPQTYHDIALIAVERPVILSKKVYPVCLPSARLRNKIQTDNSNVTVTGWGDTSHGGKSSEELQELTVPIVTLKECNAVYSKFSKVDIPQGITKQQICAGGQEGGKDACNLDSGGPLVSKLKDNSYVQVGIVSFGYKCAQPGFPTIYTNVSEYSKWIYDNTDLGK